MAVGTVEFVAGRGVFMDPFELEAGQCLRSGATNGKEKNVKK